MDWLFDNIIIIAVIGSAIARWLSGLKEDNADTPPSERPGRGQVDAEQVERNRRLREEIRRKREQRRGGQATSTSDSAPAKRPAYNPHVPEQPAPAPQLPEQIPPVLREMLGIPEQAPAAAPTPPPVPESNPVLDRQQRMEQEMAELAAKRKEAEAMARKAGVGMASPRRRRAKRTATADLSERDFLATLRNPAQARRAILLREILGKPVGLR